MEQNNQQMPSQVNQQAPQPTVQQAAVAPSPQQPAVQTAAQSGAAAATQAPKKSGVGRLAIAVFALLVLGALGYGLYMYYGQNSTDDEADTTEDGGTDTQEADGDVEDDTTQFSGETNSEDTYTSTEEEFADPSKPETITNTAATRNNAFVLETVSSSSAGIVIGVFVESTETGEQYPDIAELIFSYNQNELTITEIRESSGMLAAYKNSNADGTATIDVGYVGEEALTGKTLFATVTVQKLTDGEATLSLSENVTLGYPNVLNAGESVMEIVL